MFSIRSTVFNSSVLVYHIYLGSVEYTIHNTNRYIIEFRADGCVGVFEVRIRRGKGRQMTLAVCKN